MIAIPLFSIQTDEYSSFSAGVLIDWEKKEIGTFQAFADRGDIEERYIRSMCDVWYESPMVVEERMWQIGETAGKDLYLETCESGFIGTYEDWQEEQAQNFKEQYLGDPWENTEPDLGDDDDLDDNEDARPTQRHRIPVRGDPRLDTATPIRVRDAAGRCEYHI